MASLRAGAWRGGLWAGQLETRPRSLLFGGPWFRPPQRGRTTPGPGRDGGRRLLIGQVDSRAVKNGLQGSGPRPGIRIERNVGQVIQARRPADGDGGASGIGAAE